MNNISHLLPNQAPQSWDQSRLEAGLTELTQLWRRYQAEPTRDARELFIELYNKLKRVPEALLCSVAEAAPENGAPALILGLHHSANADDLRGTCTVDQISQATWHNIGKELESAQPWLRRAIELRFAPGAALRALMRAEQIQGSRTAAERLFQEVLSIAPDWLPAWIAIQGVREPRWGGSVKDMDALLTLSQQRLSKPDQIALVAHHWWWRANYTRIWDEEPETALSYADTGLKLDLNNADRAMLLNEKGTILASLDRLTEAVTVTRQATELDREAEYYEQLGRYAYRAKDYQTAIAAREAGAAMEGPDAYDCAYRLGDMFAYDSELTEVAKDRSRAVAAYERAVVLAPDDSARRRNLNAIGLEWVETEPKDEARAIAAYSAGVALGDRYSARNLANLLMKKDGDPVAAQQANAALRVAARHGSLPSMRTLVERLRNGIGEPPAPEEAAQWERAIAYYGDSEALQALAKERLDKGERQAGEVSAWLAACEGTQHCQAVIELADGLAGHRFGFSKPDLALEMIDTVEDDPNELSTDFHLSRVLLVYNKLPASERNARSLSRDLRTLRKNAKASIAYADDPTAKEDLRATMKQALPKYTAIVADIEDLLTQLKGGRRAEFFWDWFGGPVGWLLRPKPTDETRPNLARSTWR